MIRGLLRRGGRAVGAIRGAAGYERKGNNGKAGNNNFFHKCNGDLIVTLQSMIAQWVGSRLWGVTLPDTRR
jgi:hypothetical protein